jgi:hypothetical protein
MKHSIKIKDYTCTRTLLPNGVTTFKCTCPAWEEALKRGVPCKHILAVLFTQSDVSKWESMRLSFAKQYSMSNGKAEMILGRGLRCRDQAVLNWVAGYHKGINPPRQFMMGEI